MKNIDTTKQYLVVGLGVTGASCVRYLVARGCSVAVIDSRQAPPAKAQIEQEFPQVIMHLGDLDANILSAADVLVMSPGVPLATPAIQQAINSGVEISSDIELFLNEFDGKWVAITGSNAKSTVTQWLGEALMAGGHKTLIAGNIGTPVLSVVDQMFDVAVLELSSFQLELLSQPEADVAVVLNISEDHMDRYDSLDDYRRAKLRIYEGAHHMLVNREDELTWPEVKTSKQLTSFGLHETDQGYGLSLHQGELYICHNAQPVLAASQLGLPGRHNQANAMAVLALADSIGNDRSATLSSLKVFKGLPHRCQLVAEKSGVQFFNDSKATNVGSVLAALTGLADAEHKKIILLAGGEGKGQNFDPLIEPVAASCKAVLLFGADREKIQRSLSSAELVETLAQAFDRATAIAQPGDIVLLSPACASFDQFSGFAARGDAFVDLVEAYDDAR
ncbi:UDP-N-acetylmuramoyl-L-alanine--D-glutamate ligase [Reinekea thalattae]|uniref:UDP-N-acetylmuramoylalanine--D-glutamate ligase n=1 Tax=Reinekea thalattae TaxID=2593301 RepID=A0A5C8Z512_9GAMM|nr:UDP-N-acetylmuramoyl-L-alanine--D-glutamate ligase [Reinekea thalattae]TXR51996.1 UDP-N-acetylmuramoyl-L-alanine--D-glutamate ligase [Reinekea thalattae]